MGCLSLDDNISRGQWHCTLPTSDTSTIAKTKIIQENTKFATYVYDNGYDPPTVLFTCVQSTDEEKKTRTAI